MNRVIFDCQTHKGERITNFCCLRTCLTPLCPDCIDEHNKKHQNERTHPEIDTLKRVQGMCANKMDFVGNNLDEFLNKLNSATNLDLETSVQKTVQDLETIRKRLIDQINSYFKALQEEYIAKTQAAMNAIPDFKDLKAKIEGIMEEASNIRSNLENNNSFEAIKCTINLDSDALFQNVEKWIADAMATMIVLPTHLVFKDNYSGEFFAELKNIVRLDSKEVKLVTNERQLNLKVSQRDDKSQGLVKSYFDSKFKPV